MKDIALFFDSPYNHESIWDQSVWFEQAIHCLSEYRSRNIEAYLTDPYVRFDYQFFPERLAWVSDELEEYGFRVISNRKESVEQKSKGLKSLYEAENLPIAAEESSATMACFRPGKRVKREIVPGIPFSQRLRFPRIENGVTFWTNRAKTRK